MKNQFIVIEGLDGAGKTTQIRLLREALEEKGVRVHVSTEPTEYESGKALRRVLSGEEKKSVCEIATMFTLDRIAHNVHPTEGIEALLESGVDVICDRYYYSSLANQGSSTSYEWVKSLNLDCPEIRRPDICIFLDLTPEQSLERISKGRESVEIYENLETLTKVRNKFLSVINDLSSTDNIRIIDGYRAPDEVAKDIAEIVGKL